MVSDPGAISNSNRAGDNAMLPSEDGADCAVMEIDRNNKNRKAVLLIVVCLSCQQANPAVDEIEKVRVVVPVLAA